MTPNDIRHLIPKPAFGTLIDEGYGATDLSRYSVDELQAIDGIGPVYAKQIRDALNSLASPSDHPKTDGITAALEMAMALLVACDRSKDVANLKYRLTTESADMVLTDAIAILENLPGGERGANLANQVRAMLPK